MGKKPARKKTGGSATQNRGRARTTHEGGAPAPPAQLAPRPAVGYNLAANKGPSLAHLLNKYAPGIGALRDYHRPWLRADVFAGIAVAAYLVPQVMAYASIVGVPPVAGLWTALAALIVYAALGGSRVLSVGPESTVALMAGATVAPLAGGDPARAVALTSALALVVAGWCLIARIVRLGVATDLLSTPLLVGYLAGGAVLMVVGQLGRLTGTEVSGEGIVEQVTSFIRVVSETDLLTLAVGAGTLVLLLAVVRLRPRWPGPLIAVATATIVCAVAQLADRGVAVVGQVPTGLPGVHFCRDDRGLQEARGGRSGGRDRRIRRQQPHRTRLPRAARRARRPVAAGRPGPGVRRARRRARGLGPRRRLPGVVIGVPDGARARRWCAHAAVLARGRRRHRRRPLRRRASALAAAGRGPRRRGVLRGEQARLVERARSARAVSGGRS